MLEDINAILAERVYHDHGLGLLGEYSEFCDLIKDEYEDLFNDHHDILLHRVDEDDLEEILDQTYLEYMQICP